MPPDPPWELLTLVSLGSGHVDSTSKEKNPQEGGRGFLLPVSGVGHHSEGVLRNCLGFKAGLSVGSLKQSLK